MQARRLEVALEAAARWRAHVILKGFHTILATPDGRAFVNTTGNPGHGHRRHRAMCSRACWPASRRSSAPKHWERVLGLGVYLHGLAGDLAAARVGRGSAGGLRPDRSAARGFCATPGGVGPCLTLRFVSHSAEETMEFGRDWRSA